MNNRNPKLPAVPEFTEKEIEKFVLKGYPSVAARYAESAYILYLNLKESIKKKEGK